MSNRVREPDFGQFLRVLRREGRPSHLPFYEHKASPAFIAGATGVPLDRMSTEEDEYWKTYVDFWVGLGFDCVPMEVRLSCPILPGHGLASEGSEANAVISTLEDFERYAWPDEDAPIDLRPFETAARYLPEGMKLVAGPGRGPYEWVSLLMGTIGLSYALVDDPELVELMFGKFEVLHVNAVRQLAAMEEIGALRQGDDLGFRTATFLSPECLRARVFPIYRRMAEEAHARGKPFILHSCGNLSEVYEDLISYCRIDAKHSFEDAILPVAEFKRRYGERITPLGGLDVDVVCRSEEEELRAYTRRAVEECFHDGWWALGTGNSLTDYMPVEKYLIVLDEAKRLERGWL